MFEVSLKGPKKSRLTFIMQDPVIFSVFYTLRNTIKLKSGVSFGFFQVPGKQLLSPRWDRCDF